nr:DDE-type integrase/transposase/recombinase [Klugiella xanthotipulae]
MTPRHCLGSHYVSFMTDVYSRRIVGSKLASTLETDALPLQALEMTACQSGGSLDGLIHHSDHDSNYMSMVYTNRIAELGAIPSTGTVSNSQQQSATVSNSQQQSATVSDSYDNSMVELATLE